MMYNEQAMILKISPDGVHNQLGTWTINGGLEMKYDASTVISGRRFFRVGTAKVSLHFISGSAYHDIRYRNRKSDELCFCTQSLFLGRSWKTCGKVIVLI